ncbi:hypothetical protein [Mesorhizobium erdmanii]|uniref:Uncharacterized protein n=1 Tax=Mesorhizobium erdmanii TaxID=1777866 RepID=A0A6M7UIR5_9HYPH|nr:MULTISPECIES: hypothetical protein [Mesorhizobium]OBQ73595.1 hypothetical protein A8146_23545 [Mesorhizobium loti]QKC76013.1 hypothetical protein EB233_11070 [Mesorhizobium erdmanii]
MRRKEAVEKASAGAGDRDTILVKIEVAMESRDPEVEGRKRLRDRTAAHRITIVLLNDEIEGAKPPCRVVGSFRI